MKKATIKKQILTITLILTLVTTATLVVLPIVSGQGPLLQMSAGTQAILNFPFPVDLNGPTSQLEGIKFAYKPPGATEFIITTDFEIDNEPGLPGERYVTDDNGDCDIIVLFDQVGAYEIKWVHPATGAESEVVTVSVVAEIVVGTYLHVNVGPNPIGVNQQVTVNMFTAIPTYPSDFYENFTVIVTDPQGHETELGPFTSDTTGGTYTVFTPDQVGIWKFQAFYPGQTLSSGETQLPDESEVFELTVQEDPVTRESFPIPPGPQNYWNLPINAMNAENWYWHMGEWWGFESVTFEQTGGNDVGFYNPYTAAVKSAHVLWTKPWGAGGVAGGESGPDQVTGHFWTTRQYQPQYAPVIMEGIMYANWYTTEEAAPGHNGIMATSIFTGETLWIIDTYERLRCGYSPTWHNLNEYGTVGPYIITTGDHPGVDTAGTTYNLYDGLTGKYIASIINGQGLELTLDDDRDLLGFYLDDVEVDGTTERHLFRWDMTECLRTTTNGEDAFGWNLRQDYEFDFDRGIVWSKKIVDWTEIQGATQYQSLSVSDVTNNEVVLTASGRRSDPWNLVAVMDKNTGAQLWSRNISSLETDSFLPFTRSRQAIADGLWINANMENFNIAAYNTRTGTKAWGDIELTGDNGANPHWYDLFNLHITPGPGVSLIYGFGGDIWCIENANGNVRWYTNTTKLVGPPGAENPYAIWPLWTFNCEAITNEVAYLNIGHEYNPPLFPGARMLAINITDGSLVFSHLGMYIRSTAVAYDTLLSLNAYDNQIYALGRGPSFTTVKAPDYGVTLGTPVTITGTVMDISAGTEQNEQAKRFPNGLPCISDEDQSHFMEYVYQEQTLDYEVSGVEVVISTVDPNNNIYELGRTTSSSSGVFGLTVEPPVPGLYKIIATFDTTDSYWGSCAETYMYVGEAPTSGTPIEPEQPTEQPTEPEPEAPFITTEIAIIIAVAVIAIVAIAAYWILRRRQ